MRVCLYTSVNRMVWAQPIALVHSLFSNTTSSPFTISAYSMSVLFSSPSVPHRLLLLQYYVYIRYICWIEILWLLLFLWDCSVISICSRIRFFSFGSGLSCQWNVKRKFTSFIHRNCVYITTMHSFTSFSYHKTDCHFILFLCVIYRTIGAGYNSAILFFSRSISFSFCVCVCTKLKLQYSFRCKGMLYLLFQHIPKTILPLFAYP